MIGLGTIANVTAIIAGGLLGTVFGRFMTEELQKIISAAIALCVVFMAISGAVAKMLVITGDSVSTTGTYMLIFSLVLGSIAGEFIDIDRHIEQFGRWLRKKSGNSKDPKFVDAFVTASLTVCIGAMAVMGSLMDGLTGDHSILFTKALLDAVIILVMTSSSGKGAIFSAIPVGIFQGTITLFARLLAPVMNEAAMNNLSLTGSVLIFCIGVNMLAEGRFRIKVANMLPAVAFAVLAAYLPFLNG